MNSNGKFERSKQIKFQIFRAWLKTKWKLWKYGLLTILLMSTIWSGCAPDVNNFHQWRRYKPGDGEHPIRRCTEQEKIEFLLYEKEKAT